MGARRWVLVTSWVVAAVSGALLIAAAVTGRWVTVLILFTALLMAKWPTMYRLVEGRVARAGIYPSKRFYGRLLVFSLIKTALAIILLWLGIRAWSR